MKVLNPNEICSFKQNLPHNCIYTNYFSPIQKPLLLSQTQKTLIFLKLIESFYQMYFITSDLKDFDTTLKNLPFDNLSLHIVQKGELESNLKNIIQKYFKLEGKYEKMLIQTKNLQLKMKPIPEPNNIFYATQNDLDFIHQSLYRDFDIRFDHLPDKKTIIELLKNQQAIVIKEDSIIKAYCIYTLNAKTAHFNYLLNLEAMPFEIIALMEKYYQDMKKKNIQYIYLWVDVIKNKRVKAMHIKYGYQSSNIFNYVFNQIK
ncbi:hypothetical protein [Helicobacter sp. 13S00477-4]|uniref:hypothetical protein n=1 Tax=Helicobacter sp. 13S00477-4 TaxID=1905759 RepID=UPI000BA61349|nr:hypothetical protein [Helicobacter sp. 13S00477-4]PAF51507.1 hypothetical protein BKH44_05540 [Helicobacter sp. 13S00477-4]